MTRPGFAPSIEKKEGDCVFARRFMRSRNFESLQSSVGLVNLNGEPPDFLQFFETDGEFMVNGPEDNLHVLPEEAMDLNRIVGLPEKATPP